MSVERLRTLHLYFSRNDCALSFGCKRSALNLIHRSSQPTTVLEPCFELRQQIPNCFRLLLQPRDIAQVPLQRYHANLFHLLSPPPPKMPRPKIYERHEYHYSTPPSGSSSGWQMVPSGFQSMVPSSGRSEYTVRETVSMTSKNVIVERQFKQKQFYPRK